MIDNVKILSIVFGLLGIILLLFYVSGEVNVSSYTSVYAPIMIQLANSFLPLLIVGFLGFTILISVKGLPRF